MGNYKILERLGLDEPALTVEESRKMSRDEEREYVQKKFPFVPQPFLLKQDVPRRGVTISKEVIETVQDPFYAHGPRILFQWHHEDYPEEYSIPIDFKLNDGTGVCMQLTPPDVGEPYAIEFKDGKSCLIAGERVLEEVSFSPACQFEREGKTTRSGVPLIMIAQVSSRGLMLIPNSHCQYWNNGNQCLFCDMDYNARQAMKMGRGWKLRLKADDVYDCVSEALKEKGRWHHILMTGGSNPRKNYEKEHSQVIELLNVIEKANEPYEYKIPVNLIATPYKDDEQYQTLKDAGLKGFGGYIETWKKEHWELVCPGKAEFFTYEEYLDRIFRAVDFFGEGNVTAGFVIGTEMAPPPYGFAEVDEAVNSTLEGYDFLIKNKVIPMGTNWCIQPGTDFYKMGAVQPPLEFYIKVDIGRYRLMQEHFGGSLSADQMHWKFQSVGSYGDWQRIL